MKANRFTAFADEDQQTDDVKKVQQQVQAKRQDNTQKKVVVKVQQHPSDQFAHEF
jgi:hypothetical protein